MTNNNNQKMSITLIPTSNSICSSQEYYLKLPIWRKQVTNHQAPMENCQSLPDGSILELDYESYPIKINSQQYIDERGPLITKPHHSNTQICMHKIKRLSLDHTLMASSAVQVVQLQHLFAKGIVKICKTNWNIMDETNINKQKGTGKINYSLLFNNISM